MFSVALVEPEIPQNTGNIARLCAATQTPLHIVGATGFRLDDRAVRRAGLDYWPCVDLARHPQMHDFEAGMPAEGIFCFSAHATRLYTQVRYQAGDAFVFGSESRGLPPEVLARHAERALKIPMP